MVCRFLECDYKAGSYIILSGHQKVFHEDKIDKFECIYRLLGGVCFKIDCYNNNSSSVDIIA